MTLHEFWPQMIFRGSFILAQLSKSAEPAGSITFTLKEVPNLFPLPSNSFTGLLRPSVVSLRESHRCTLSRKIYIISPFRSEQLVCLGPLGTRAPGMGDNRGSGGWLSCTQLIVIF